MLPIQGHGERNRATENCVQFPLLCYSGSFCFVLLFLLIFFFFDVFFLIWKAELKYSQGRPKSNSNLCSFPILFFLGGVFFFFS